MILLIKNVRQDFARTDDDDDVGLHVLGCEQTECKSDYLVFVPCTWSPGVNSHISNCFACTISTNGIFGRKSEQSIFCVYK